MLRRIWILSLLLVLVGCAALATETLGSGSCGTGMTWNMVKGDDGLITLEISGKGAITQAPWRELKDPGELLYVADRLVLNEGITQIPQYAFSGCLQAGAALEMPSTLRQIGAEAFRGAFPVSLVLNEGLVSILDNAFDFDHCCPTVIVPRSLAEIGYQALPASGTLYVYPDSEGEQWCMDWGIPFQSCTGALNAREASLKRLLDAIAAADDVPLRYRQPAIETLKGMTSLTADQLDGLTEYVTQEYAALRTAMSDNDLSIVEIAGFTSRFMTRMTDIGVTVSCGNRYIGGYWGVRLEVTVNGATQELLFYRNRDYWDLSRLSVGTTSKYSWRETGAGLVLTGYSSSTTSLTVPATLNGKPVIGVEGDNGSWPSNLVNLELPEGLKFIGRYAFSGMKKLVNVTLPDSLEHIYDGAFYGCDKITQVTFGPKLRTLGNAFEKSGVTSFSLPASLERLGRKLPSMTIDPDNPHFTKEDGALYNNDTKTLLWAWEDEIAPSFTVKDGTQCIGRSAFQDVTVLTGVSLPDSVVEISGRAFEGCVQLNAVTLNEGLEKIGVNAFCDCKSLTALTLPSTLVEMGVGALRRTGITNLSIPAALFADPDQWGSLRTLIKVDMEALFYIDVAPGHPLYESEYGVLYEKGTHTLLCVPRAISWPPAVRENTWVIADGAFENCALIPGIYLPAGVTTIGNDALSGTSIESLVLPDSVDSIGYQKNLSGLLEITIPASVTELGFFQDSGFSSDEKRTKVYGVPGTAAESLATYQHWEFCPVDASGITGFQMLADGKPVASLTMWQGDVVEVIANNSGENMDAVLWDLGDSDNRRAAQVLSRKGRALLLCGGAPGTSTYTVSAADDPAVTCTLQVTVKALSAATPDCAMLPAGLKAVETNAFRNTKFRYVSIPDGATSIGSRAFMDCPNLKVVRVPESMTFIAADAFEGCSDVVVVYGCQQEAVNRLYGNPNIRCMIDWNQSYPWASPWLIS